MMANIKSRIKGAARPRSYTGTILSIVNGAARIALSHNGSVISNVPVVGSAAIGSTVTITYISGDPIAYSSGSPTQIPTSRYSQTAESASAINLLQTTQALDIDTDDTSISGWLITDTGLKSDNGLITLDPITPSILVGDATDYMAGTGVFIGYNTVTSTAYKTHIGNPSSQYIGWDGSSLTIAGTIQSTNFNSGVSGWQITAAGDAELNNVVVRGEIVTSIFRYNEITATAGDLGVFKGGGVLVVDAISVASPETFQITYNGSPLAANDIVRIKDGLKDNWCFVTTVVGDVYTLELKSGTPGTFSEGIPVINYGPSGQGGILLTANNTYAPYIDIFTHAGEPWTTITSKTRVGKLDGITDADLNPTGYGLYSDNVFLKGSIVAGAGKVILSDYGISVATGRTSDFGYIRFEDTIGSSIPVGSISIDDHAIFATYATGVGIDATHTATQDTLQEAGEIHLSARVDSIPYWSHSNYAEMWLTAYSEPNPGGAVYFAARQGVVSRTMKLKVYGTMEADFLDLEDSTAPATPASGYGRLYVNSDTLYFKTDAGIEKPISGAVFVPLTSPLTSTSWDGDGRSTTAKTVIDLSAVFGVPAGAKAVYIKIYANDAASSTTSCYIGFGPTDTAGSFSVVCKPYQTPNDNVVHADGMVPCDANGDIYFQCVASSSGALDVSLRIWGYWI